MEALEKSDSCIARVQVFLDTLLPLDWNAWDLERRREFWRGDRNGGAVHRRRVCALEIWQELFALERVDFDGRSARRLNKWIREIPYWNACSSVECGPLYGRQRGFLYDALDERLDKMEE